MVSSVGSSTSFDLEAIKQMRQEMFTKMDTNADGSVDKTEMQTYADEMASSTGETMNVDEMFAMMDTDSNGLISQAESEAAPPPPPPPGGGEDPFDEIDSDDDGYITTDELQSFLDEMSSTTGATSPSVEEIFAQQDTDGDGLISRAESDAAMEKMMANGEISTESTETIATESITDESIQTLLESVMNQEEEEASELSQSYITQYTNSAIADLSSSVDILS